MSDLAIPGHCCVCDHYCDENGTKMVHFVFGEEKIIEYYCSTRCIREAWQ